MKLEMATEKDIDKLLMLTKQAYKPIKQLGIEFAAIYADREMVEKNIRENMCFYLKENEEIISTITLRMPWSNTPGPYNVPHIWWLASIRKGAGKLILDKCENEILLGYLKSTEVSLGTAREHPWLVEYYEKMNYKIVGSANLSDSHTTVYMKKNLGGTQFE